MENINVSGYSSNILRTMARERIRRANTRLRNLEKRDLTSSNAYRYVDENFGGRFSARGVNKMTHNELVHLVTELTKFLNAKTSTVRGVKRAYSKSYNTLVKKYNLSNLSFENFVSIMENESIESFKSRYGSSQLVRMLGISNDKNIDSIKNVIEKSYGKSLIELDEDINTIPDKSEWQPIDENEEYF